MPNTRVHLLPYGRPFDYAVPVLNENDASGQSQWTFEPADCGDPPLPVRHPAFHRDELFTCASC